MFDIPLIASAVLLLLLVLIYFLNNSRKNLTDPYYYWVIILFFTLEVFFLFFLFLSTKGVFNDLASLIFWEFAIFLKIFNIGMLGSIHGYVLLNNKKRFIPPILYSAVGGIILSLLIEPSSIVLSQINSLIQFNFDSLFLLIFLSSFLLLHFISTVYIQLFHKSNISHKETQIIFNRFSILFILSSQIYLLYLYFQNALLITLNAFFVLMLLSFLTYIIFRKESIFTVVTNKIYNFIIFHRSGILLFSFNFETQKETDESILKGSILIGINHILSSFTEKKDKLNLIKMKDRDIIFEYNNEFEYGLLLITKQKTKIIERKVKRFIEKFNKLNKIKLQKINDVNKIIDISEFKNTKQIIMELFNPYMDSNDITSKS